MLTKGRSNLYLYFYLLGKKLFASKLILLVLLLLLLVYICHITYIIDLISNIGSIDNQIIDDWNDILPTTTPIFYATLENILNKNSSNDNYYNYGKLGIKSRIVSVESLKQPRSGYIYCFVATSLKFHQNRISSLAQTWLPECDSWHIYSNSNKYLDSLPYHVIFHKIPNDYKLLFWKSRLALFYSYTFVSPNFDWYLKADDDSYFIMDRMKTYLRQFDPEKPYFIGFRNKRRYPKGYLNGGGGYIISKSALKRFVSQAFPSKKLCSFFEWEDLAISRCFRNVGVTPLDSRDEHGRQRFLAFSPDEHYFGTINSQWTFDKVNFTGFDVYHKNVFSFHHISPQEIRLIHVNSLYGYTLLVDKNCLGTLTFFHFYALLPNRKKQNFFAFYLLEEQHFAIFFVN